MDFAEVGGALRRVSKTTYSAEFLLNPLPFALLTGGMFPLLVAILRIAQVALLAIVTEAPLRGRDLLLVPLLDVLQFGAQFVPYIDNRVTWRGYTAGLGRNTELIDIAKAA